MLAFRRLRDLGTSGNGGLEAYESPVRELQQWVATGATPQGAPTPKPEHAGSQQGDAAARRTAVAQRAESLLTSYQGLFDNVEKRSEISVPRAYELRTDILACLDEIQHAVRDHDVAAGTDTWN